jgi:hypothetical protein
MKSINIRRRDPRETNPVVDAVINLGEKGVRASAPKKKLWLNLVIVGLDGRLKGPHPLVGESKLSRVSKMSRSDF